ncbi:MAG TPA: hypothetical protein VE987_02460 [Polyangiaceae bacterium]|nr:hypothetical protein [Polyangiaceae bacterium]
MGSATRKPLDNLTYDIVTILHEKSKALEAYDQYLADAQADASVAALLDSIRRHEEDDVDKLRFELGRLLGQASQRQGQAGTVGAEQPGGAT